MLPIETIIMFLLMNMSLCLAPSPEMIMVVTQSSLQGRWAGIVFVAGVVTALIGQVVVMLLGLSAIIKTSEFAFTFLKYIGAGYLLFLAVQASKTPIVISEGGKRSKSELYFQGVFINISNPMNPLYLLLVFPLFINKQQGPVDTQIMMLGLVLIVAILIMYTMLSIAGELAGKKIMQSKKIRRYLKTASSIVIAGFAIFLLLADHASISTP